MDVKFTAEPCKMLENVIFGSTIIYKHYDILNLTKQKFGTTFLFPEGLEDTPR